MTKSKNTKKALLTSVLSMMLCAAMLIGSTFAWFTDSAISGKNKIVAGNLDVELEYSTDATEWKSVSTDTNMFKEGALWEPGYTEVVYLRVKNAGSLALKYKFGINVADEKAGTNVDGKEFNLSDYIEFGVVEVDKKFDDRAAARNAVKGSADLISKGYSSEEGHLTAGNFSKMLALVVYMPEETGNEANHKTDAADPTKYQPSIDLGIKLVATQDTVEKDSFGKDYDAKANYPVTDAASAKTALENGGPVVLIEDVKVAPVGEGKDLVAQMSVDKDTILDLSGKTLSVDTAATTESLSYTPALIAVKEGGTLTIDGDGVVNAEAGNNSSYGIDVQGGSLVINNGTFYGAMSAVQVETGTVVINGGFFDMAPTVKGILPKYAKYIVNAIDANYKNGTAKIEIKGGTFVNFNPSDNPEGAGTSYVAEGYKVVSEEQSNGEIWYTVVPDLA